MSPQSKEVLADINELPEKQRLTLDKLIEFVEANGYPPSIQQLCELCGVTSTSTIHYHVTALRKKGFIDWNSAEKRSITIREDLVQGRGTSRSQLPLLGTIAAGQPLLQMPDMNQSSTERIDLSSDLCPEGCYALKVKGLSMIEDHIMDGDMIIVNPKHTVRDGDMVVALVEGESTTLKRIYREPDRVRLQPSNPEMEPIYSNDVQVQGKVEAIIRRMNP